VGGVRDKRKKKEAKVISCSRYQAVYYFLEEVPRYREHKHVQEREIDQIAVSMPKALLVLYDETYKISF
jgi:hypothetical protein